MAWVAVAVAAVSAVSAISAGQQQAQNLKLQSRQAELNADAERLEGRREALAIEGDLARDLASQNALFGARGVLEGEGTAEAAAEASKENASADIERALFNAEITALSGEQRSSNLKSDASAAKREGFLKAAEAGASGFGSFKAGSSTSSSSTSVPRPVKRPSLLSGR